MTSRRMPVGSISSIPWLPFTIGNIGLIRGLERLRPTFLKWHAALWLIASSMVVVSTSASGADIIDFQRDIGPVFASHCLECHNAEKAKADFRIDDRDIVLGYIEPGDESASTLWSDYLRSDDESMRMPPKESGHVLDAGELALIQLWIREGAKWPDGAIVAAAEPAQTGDVAEESDASLPMASRAWRFIGYFHPAVVHFPIALIAVGGLLVVLGWRWPALADGPAKVCLVIGALSSIVACAMGASLAPQRGFGDWDASIGGDVFWHRWLGIALAVLSTFLAVVACKAKQPSMIRLWRFGLLFAALLVSVVGHLGGDLTYGETWYERAFAILLGK
jgi:uncharacterized membrane protein